MQTTPTSPIGTARLITILSTTEAASIIQERSSITITAYLPRFLPGRLQPMHRGAKWIRTIMDKAIQVTWWRRVKPCSSPSATTPTCPRQRQTLGNSMDSKQVFETTNTKATEMYSNIRSHHPLLKNIQADRTNKQIVTVLARATRQILAVLQVPRRSLRGRLVEGQGHYLTRFDGTPSSCGRKVVVTGASS